MQAHPNVKFQSSHVHVSQLKILIIYGNIKNAHTLLNVRQIKLNKFRMWTELIMIGWNVNRFY